MPAEISAELASPPLMIVGALSPWARAFGERVDGSQDEFVLLLAIVAAFMLLFLAASERRWLALVPLLAGLTAAGLTGSEIRDIPDFAGRWTPPEARRALPARFHGPALFRLPEA